MINLFWFFLILKFVKKISQVKIGIVFTRKLPSINSSPKIPEILLLIILKPKVFTPTRNWKKASNTTKEITIKKIFVIIIAISLFIFSKFFKQKTIAKEKKIYLK